MREKYLDLQKVTEQKDLVPQQQLHGYDDNELLAWSICAKNALSTTTIFSKYVILSLVRRLFAPIESDLRLETAPGEVFSHGIK